MLLNYFCFGISVKSNITRSITRNLDHHFNLYIGSDSYFYYLKNLLFNNTKVTVLVYLLSVIFLENNLCLIH